MSGRTKQSIKTKIQNMKMELLKKLSAKSHPADSSCEYFLNVVYFLVQHEFEEFMQPLYVHANEHYFLVYPKSNWKEIKVSLC
jgi:hypothetical protein